MRKLAFLILLRAAVATASAQTPVSVSQIEQLLSTLHGQQDTKIARQVSSLEPTERIRSARLAHWLMDFPGDLTHQALTALADASAFLALPAADLPPTPPPDLATQRQIVSRMVDYVSKTVPKLPNFSAQRTTTYFEVATPDQLRNQEQFQIFQLNYSKPSNHSLGPRDPSAPKGAQLYFGGTWNTIVTYRDEHEVEEAPVGNGKRTRAPLSGLTTSGEFGPILAVVNQDAIYGKIIWSHWEQGIGIPLAVFHYEVPKERSHYAVTASEGDDPEFPAYQGEIAADPASGAIFRISVQASQLHSRAMTEAAVLVEYAPVLIGGSTYICPVRGVASSQEPISGAIGTSNGPSVQLLTFVNDVSFTQYHLFRSESRVLPAGP